MKQEEALDKYLQEIGLPSTLQLPFYSGPPVEVTNGILLACRHKNDWPEARKLLLHLLRLPNEPRYLKLGQGSKLVRIVSRLYQRNKRVLRNNCETSMLTFYATVCTLRLDIDIRYSLPYPDLPNARPVNRGFRSASVPLPVSGHGRLPVDVSEWFPDMDITCPVLSRAPSVSEDVEPSVSHTVDVTSSCHAVSQMASISEDVKPAEPSALDVTSLLPVANFSWPVLFSETSEDDVKPPLSPVHNGTTSLLASGTGNVSWSIIPEDSKPDPPNPAVSATLQSFDSPSPPVPSVPIPLTSSTSTMSPLPRHWILEHRVKQLKLELERKNKRIIHLQNHVKAQNQMIQRRNVKMGNLEFACKVQKQLNTEMTKKQEKERQEEEEKKNYARNEMRKMSDSLEYAFAKVEKAKAETVAMQRRADEAEEKLCEMEERVQKKLVVWDKQQNKFSDHCFEHIVRFSKLGIPGNRLPKALECAASFAEVTLDRTPSAGTCRRATLLDAKDSGRVTSPAPDEEPVPDADASKRAISPDAYSDCSL